MLLTEIASFVDVRWSVVVKTIKGAQRLWLAVSVSWQEAAAVEDMVFLPGRGM
jgi:hypothetical protein